MRTMAACMVAIAVGLAPIAHGGDHETDKGYRLSLTPYAWLINLKGTVGARGYSLPVDTRFTDATKHLNFAGMLAVDAIFRNSFGITANLNFAMLGSHGSVRGISLDSSSSMLLSDAAGFYRVASLPLGSGCGVGVDFDLLAGVRVWRGGLKLDVDFFGTRRQFSQNELWVDPLVGARTVIRLGDRWSVRLRGGVGGFSVGSKKTWDAAAIAGYAVNDRVSLVAGYRALGVDYRKGGGRDRFVFDVTLKGPLVGAVFSF